MSGSPTCGFFTYSKKKWAIRMFAGELGGGAGFCCGT